MSKTISGIFHKVLEVLLILHIEIVHQSTKHKLLVDQIAKDTKYNACFKDYLGALDGTHLSIHIPVIDCTLFQNGKRNLSQNMLRVCTFNLKFCYIIPGWEDFPHNDYILEKVP